MPGSEEPRGSARVELPEGELKLTRRREHACRLNRLASSAIRGKMIRFPRPAFRNLTKYEWQEAASPGSMLTFEERCPKTRGIGEPAVYAPRVQTVSCFRADLGAASAAERPISGRPTTKPPPRPIWNPNLEITCTWALDPPFGALVADKNFSPTRQTPTTLAASSANPRNPPGSKTPSLSRSSRCVWSSSAAVSFRGWARVSFFFPALFPVLSQLLVGCGASSREHKAKPELPLHEIYFYLPRDATRCPGLGGK